MLTLEQSLYALRPRPGISTWEPEEPLQDPPVDHFPSPPTVRHPTVPSPIAESPVREAASIKDHAPIDPSHAEHAPPPKIDSAADGPGALVGESEELPQPADRSPSPPPSSHTVTPDPGSEPKRKRISSQNFQRLARRISLSTRRSSSSIIPGLKRDSSPRVSTDEGAGTSNDSPVGSITDKDKEEVMEEDKEEKKEEKKDKTNRGLAMVPSSTAEPPECETELDAKRVAEPEAGYESGRNHESLHRSVREAFAPDSMHEAEREAAREPAVENHALIGHSLPAQGIAIDETTLSTPVDEYVPPALISSAAGPGAFTDQEDLPLPMAVMDPAHPFPSSMYEEPHVAVPNALNEQTTPSRVEPIITDSYPDLLRMAESIAAPPMPTPSHQLCSNSGVDGDAVPEQEAEGVVMPDSRDAGGRSRAPSIRMPVCDSVADPTDPETDLPRPNESSPDILGPYEQVGGMSHAEDDDGIPAEMSVPDPDHVLRLVTDFLSSFR
ncbi:hypothetical protein BD779DRAFT_541083 [Infundibulicybe gibba]|nr:hypothetical protein BD779DRAFT_541083 [Infundibulicybe gibba]